MWFKLDDEFHSHPKVHVAGNAGAGLWVRCATWSTSYLTDGVIPVEVVEYFGTKVEAARVERAGLWVTEGTHVRIPDWLDYQPAADEVREKRREAAERMRELREKRRGADGRFG